MSITPQIIILNTKATRVQMVFPRLQTTPTQKNKPNKTKTQNSFPTSLWHFPHSHGAIQPAGRVEQK
jgi:hypothetical protein